MNYKYGVYGVGETRLLRASGVSKPAPRYGR